MKSIFILFILVLTSNPFSQYENIKINKLENWPNEVTVSINPTNPLNIVAGANVNNYYYTFDGGNTWENGTLVSEEYGVWGDPCVIFGPDGNSFYFHLAFPPKGYFIDRIVCQKSTNGGMEYSSPGTFTGLYPPKGEDKEWACADWTRKNNLYVCWTRFDKYGSKDTSAHSNIMFSYSSDAGINWSEAQRINEIPGDCLDSSNTVEGAVPCMGPNGEIYVSWSGPAGIEFTKSTDGGISWPVKNVFICEQIGGWNYAIEGLYRCNGMAITCCDLSKYLYRGTIYVNFSDLRNGASDVDIFLTKSIDGGVSWSKPKRVNDDSFGNNKQQFMSYMSVDPVTGTINILFYDRRNYNDTQTDVYLARSTDGGESFVNIKISDTPFIPTKRVFFGDYIGVSSFNDFTANVWMRMDDGKSSIWFAGIDFKNENK